MAIEHRIEQFISSIGFRFSSVLTVNPTCSVFIEDTIPDASVDLQWDLLIKQANLVLFAAYSDYNVSIHTQTPTSGGSPQDLIAVKANKPVVWVTGMPDIPISADVDVAYIQNASGSAATLKLLMGWDISP